MQKNSALLVNGRTGSRSTECLTLEPSELLLIDYDCNGLSTSVAQSTQQYVNHNLTNHLLNNHHLHQLRQSNALNQSHHHHQQQFANTMHSSTVGSQSTNCPLNNNQSIDNSTLIQFSGGGGGEFNNSYTNLINNLNNTYLNSYHSPHQNGNQQFHQTQFTSNLNHNLQCHIAPHQRAASMYSCHSDTTATNTTTSSDSELDLNALTEQLVDDEDDDLNEEELRKLALNTDELLFGTNHHVLNNNNLTNNLIDNLISSHKPPSNRLLHLRQVLEKNSLDRTDQDNETILNYINSLSAFDKYDQSIKKQLASVMILAIIESPFTVILTHNETLDSFCCLIHGTVEHVFSNEETLNNQSNQNSRILQPGDVFGITEPSLENLYFKGIMKTLTPFCWFLCVTQHDFYKILSSTQMEVVKHEENGQVTMVTEVKKVDNKKEKIILRGTPEKLLSCVLDNFADLHFIDDFLLTYRVFMPESKLVEEDTINNNEQIDDQVNHQTDKNLNLVKLNSNAKFRHLVKGFEYVANKLLYWFEDDNLRDKIIRIVLMWINNYYLDFDLVSILDKDSNLNCSGQQFLDLFERKLANNVSLLTQLRLLHIGLSTKAKVRHINFTRNNRQDDLLNFTILGGYERGYGIFVSKVENGSKIEQLGLRKGDQILEVNGINFAIITHTKALDVLRSTTHLQMTVKYNPFIFNEMISLPEGGKQKKAASLTSAMLQLPNATASNNYHLNSTASSALNNNNGSNIRKNSSGSAGTNTPTSSSNLNSIVNNTLNISAGKWQSNVSNSGTKIKRAIPRFANFLSKHLNFTNEDSSFQNDEIDFVKPLAHRSHSNPDLHKLSKEASCQCASNSSNALINNQISLDNHQLPIIQSQPQSVIRVFNATTGDFRYLFVHPENTAKEVVMISVGEFGLCNQSSKSNNEIKSSLNYSLYEVSVVPEADNAIKQKRLPDQLNNLCDRSSFHSRYYIKENTMFSSSSSSSSGQSSSSNPNKLTDDVSSEILKECPMPITLLSLNTAQIGIELTLTDFTTFSSIEPQEFIFDIFEMKTDDLPNSKLMEFESLSNKEMFWVINEILSETNLVKRVKIIKYFIKTANICRNLHNYNSMFAILSGLGHGSVQRLKQTWEKLSTKYHKILKALQLLMDPSRNMMHYRREISTRTAPIIPFYPIVKKDLTFINLAHLTIADDGLVNFDKMRMISKEIRSIKMMSSTPYMMPSAANNNINILNNTSSISSTTNSNENSSSSSSVCTNKNCALLSKQSKDYQNLQAAVSEITGVPLPSPPPTIVSSGSVNAKRIFEESLMKKKVRHYLELCFSKINYDEDCLLSKSFEIEPGATNNNLNQSQHSQSNASIKSQSKDQLSINTGSTTTVNSSSTNGTTNHNSNKLQGSPTLSSSSGSSSGRLKFGAESPHQLRKLMSLSEVVDSGKSSHKSNHSHGLGQFLNYHNHHHNINQQHQQQQSTAVNSQQQQQQQQQQISSLNNGRFNLPSYPQISSNNQQQMNLAAQQHQLNNGNNFTHSQSSNHLRNATDSMNCNILLNTVTFNTPLSMPLSLESSSVTSLRRLEQLQQLKKFQENYYFPYNSINPSFIQQTQPQSNSPISRPTLPPNYEDALLIRKHKLANLNNTLGRSSSNNSSTSSTNRKNDKDKVSAV